MYNLRSIEKAIDRIEITGVMSNCMEEVEEVSYNNIRGQTFEGTVIPRYIGLKIDDG